MSGEILETGTPSGAVERLLARLHIVTDARQERRLLQALAQPTQPTVVSFLNQHAFNLAWEDAECRADLLRSDVLLRDGVGIAACLRLLGREPGLNTNGTDLIPRLVQVYAGRRVAIVGTTAPYAEQAAERLRESGANVVCVEDGFGDEDRYLPALAKARPDLVILGMGMPKQERIANRLADAMKAPVLIVNGGAILDFLAGRFPRAPQWLRSWHLEWFYRWVQEPRRLWRRYAIGGVRFATRALRLACGGGGDEAAVEALAHPNGWMGRAPAIPLDDEVLFAGTDTRIAQLSQRLDADLDTSSGRIVQFIAARAGDGASTVARSYALASAQLRGRRVLLLSDDLENASPRLSDGVDALLAAPAIEGVTRARLGGAHASAPGDYAAWIDAATWTTLTGRFDEVVVDAKGACATIAAAHASRVVVVVQAQVTPASAVRDLLDTLAAMNAKVVGVVLNKQRSHLPRVLRDRL